MQRIGTPADQSSGHQEMNKLVFHDAFVLSGLFKIEIKL